VISIVSNAAVGDDDIAAVGGEVSISEPAQSAPVARRGDSGVPSSSSTDWDTLGTAGEQLIIKNQLSPEVRSSGTPAMRGSLTPLAGA
jgi:hypothetical protein